MKRQLLVGLLSTMGMSYVFAEDIPSQQTSSSNDSSFYQSTIQQLNQASEERPLTPDSSIDWAKFVSFSGGLYADAKAGDQSYNTQGENNQRLSVTNANIAANAKPNDWAKLTIVANYSTASYSYVPEPSNDNVSQDGAANAFYVDQAYVTLGDEARSPFFAQLGTQYLPFGQYNINPIVKSLGQVLTETNTTDAQLGFAVPEGLYGSAYVFQNAVNETGSSDDTNPYNGGAVLGFKKSSEGLLTDIGMGYMNNMSGVDAISDYMDQNNVGYGSHVAALAPYFSFQTGPFGIKLDYVTALSSFDANSLPYESNSTQGAKPSATDMQASYAFNRDGIDHVLLIGYQVSQQASALNLPKKRYLVGYTFYPLKNLLLGFEVTRDSNYEGDNLVGDTSDGENYYTYNARIGVEF